MDARPKTRQIHRERKAPTPQPPRGAKQIIIPMNRPQYDDLWHQPDRLMYWYRLIERLGRNSLVGTTVRDAAALPTHLAADEHHADWVGRKGDIATTVGDGCVLGVALSASSADDAHLQEAYGVFAAEARDVEPEYAPETVNTNGWAATRNAFLA
ncbi:hypothetical protein [Singulisphaera acidiphila]|uniref:Uncharacterized protein n=1 Tax=Singulisphaera acidiphila (strain ATCC BAA-1392 / DSM 18658 / VKM B-2454 / MOB10) TaxID=886293 RepID=L0DPQ5_SINAD|nr:hypothetical protein [Singulisphaera acidiphila]AGA31227.1 hypothetical protein Sinac_7176 [Singulisphaera acidiphila DSM 18658]